MSAEKVRPVFTSIMTTETLTKNEATLLDEAIGEVLDRDEASYVAAINEAMRAKTIAADPGPAQLVLSLPNKKRSRLGAVFHSGSGSMTVGATLGLGFGVGVALISESGPMTVLDVSGLCGAIGLALGIRDGWEKD